MESSSTLKNNVDSKLNNSETKKSVFDSIYAAIIDKRETAPNCIVCGIKLFDGTWELDMYIHDNHIYDLYPESIKSIYYMFYEQYPHLNKDGHICRHHTNYKKNIQVPVCDSCHIKIHSGKYPEMNKWLPVDKKPKNQGKFKTNMYKPLR